MKLYPKCHPTWDGEPIPEGVKKRGIAYVGTGYLLPCCLCDNNSGDDFEKLGFLDPKLKVSNVDDIKTILLSKPWVTFHKTLINDPENAPRVCKQSCTSNKVNEYDE